MRLFSGLRNHFPMFSTSARAKGGPVQGFLIAEDGSRVLCGQKNNSILYCGADILSKLVGGQSTYRINAMYFEFVKAASIPFTPPAISLSSKTYYETVLATIGDTDFIRIALDTTPAWATSDGAKYDNNKVTFFGQTAGGDGEREKASPGDGLVLGTGDFVVGGGLIASPTSGIADDLLFSRFYFTTPIEKLAGMQIGMSWPLQFT